MNTTFLFIIWCILLFSTSLLPHVIPEYLFNRYIPHFNGVSLGVLIAFIFLELLPDCFEAKADDIHFGNITSTQFKTFCLMIGYVLAFIIDNLTHEHPEKKETKRKLSDIKLERLQNALIDEYDDKTAVVPKKRNKKRVGVRNGKKQCTGFILGKFVHGISEGVLIIPQFLKEGNLQGSMVSLSILVHEVPMNFSIYSRFYNKTGKKSVALFLNSICGSSYLFTIILYFILEYLQINKAMRVIECITIGMMLKLVVSEMLPEFEHEILKGKAKNYIRYCCFSAGLIVMSLFFLVLLPLFKK